MDTLMTKHVALLSNKKDNGHNSLKHLYFKIFKNILFLSVILGILLFIASANISTALFQNAALRPWLQATAISVPFYSILLLNNSFLCGKKKMLEYGVFLNLFPIGVTVLIFILLDYTFFTKYLPRFNESKILLFVTYGFVIMIAAMITSFLVHSYGDFKNTLAKKYLSSKQILLEGFPLLLVASLAIIINSIDIYMIGYFKTAAEVGIYDVAFKISLTLSLVLVAINAIASPQFSQLFSSNQIEKLKNLTFVSSKMIFWISFPGFIILMTFPKFFLSLFGEEFLIAENALKILLIGQFINAFCGSVGNLLKMTNQQVSFQNIMILALLANFILNFLLIPSYGIVGAAIASCISFAIINFASSWVAYSKLGVLSIYIPFFTKNHLNK